MAVTHDTASRVSVAVAAMATTANHAVPWNDASTTDVKIRQGVRMWRTTFDKVAVSSDVSFWRAYPAIVTRKIGTMTVSSVSAIAPRLVECLSLRCSRPDQKLFVLLEGMTDFTC